MSLFSKNISKIVASLVAGLFLVNSIAWGQVYSPANSADFSSPLTFSIPDALGRVTDLDPSGSERPFLVHLQDAHANYTAQKNMAKILEHLKKDQKINLVFVEGAFGKLDVRYLKFSEDSALNQKIADRLAQMGELTAADLFLANHPKGMEFVGIENPKLYREDLELLRKVLSKESESREWIASREASLERDFTRLANKDLLALLRIHLRLDKKTSSLMQVVETLDQASKRHLKRDLREAKEQKEFPNLMRFLRLKDEEGKLDLKKVKQESEEIQKRYGFKLEVGKNPRFALEELYSRFKNQGLDFRKYPNFSKQAKHLIYEQEMDAEGFYQEIDSWLELLTMTLAKTAEEKKAVVEVKNFKLTSKLLLLELTRKEWEQIKTPDSRLQTPEKKTGDWRQVSGVGSLGSAISFYRLAESREAAFLDVIQKTLKEKKQSRAIVITGGFHTDGLKSYFAKERWGYGVIMPNIEGDGRANYVATLMGRKPQDISVSDLGVADKAQSPENLIALDPDLIRWQARVAVVRNLVSKKKASSLGHEGKDFLERIKQRFPAVNERQIQSALELAQKIHEGHPRPTKMKHIMEVAEFTTTRYLPVSGITDMSLITDIISAGLLHDAIEDAAEGDWGKTEATKLGKTEIQSRVTSSIETTINPRVKKIVQALTRLETEKAKDRKAKAEQDEIYDSQLMKSPLSAQLIKLADRTQNYDSFMKVWYEKDQGKPHEEKRIPHEIARSIRLLKESEALPLRVKKKFLEFLIGKASSLLEETKDSVFWTPILTSLRETERVILPAGASLGIVDDEEADEQFRWNVVQGALVSVGAFFSLIAILSAKQDYKVAFAVGIIPTIIFTGFAVYYVPILWQKIKTRLAIPFFSKKNQNQIKNPGTEIKKDAFFFETVKITGLIARGNIQSAVVLIGYFIQGVDGHEHFNFDDTGHRALLGRFFERGQLPENAQKEVLKEVQEKFGPGNMSEKQSGDLITFLTKVISATPFASVKSTAIANMTSLVGKRSKIQIDLSKLGLLERGPEDERPATPERRREEEASSLGLPDRLAGAQIDHIAFEGDAKSLKLIALLTVLTEHFKSDPLYEGAHHIIVRQTGASEEAPGFPTEFTFEFYPDKQHAKVLNHVPFGENFPTDLLTRLVDRLYPQAPLRKQMFPEIETPATQVSPEPVRKLKHQDHPRLRVLGEWLATTALVLASPLVLLMLPIDFFAGLWIRIKIRKLERKLKNPKTQFAERRKAVEDIFRLEGGEMSLWQKIRYKPAQSNPSGKSLGAQITEIEIRGAAKISQAVLKQLAGHFKATAAYDGIIRVTAERKPDGVVFEFYKSPSEAKVLEPVALSASSDLEALQKSIDDNFAKTSLPVKGLGQKRIASRWIVLGLGIAAAVIAIVRAVTPPSRSDSSVVSPSQNKSGITAEPGKDYYLILHRHNTDKDYEPVLEFFEQVAGLAKKAGRRVAIRFEAAPDWRTVKNRFSQSHPSLTAEDEKVLLRDHQKELIEFFELDSQGRRTFILTPEVIEMRFRGDSVTIPKRAAGLKKMNQLALKIGAKAQPETFSKETFLKALEWETEKKDLLEAFLTNDADAFFKELESEFRLHEEVQRLRDSEEGQENQQLIRQGDVVLEERGFTHGAGAHFLAPSGIKYQIVRAEGDTPGLVERMLEEFRKAPEKGMSREKLISFYLYSRIEERMAENLPFGERKALVEKVVDRLAGKAPLVTTLGENTQGLEQTVRGLMKDLGDAAIRKAFDELHQNNQGIREINRKLLDPKTTEAQIKILRAELDSLKKRQTQNLALIEAKRLEIYPWLARNGFLSQEEEKRLTGQSLGLAGAHSTLAKIRDQRRRALTLVDQGETMYEEEWAREYSNLLEESDENILSLAWKQIPNNDFLEEWERQVFLDIFLRPASSKEEKSDLIHILAGVEARKKLVENNGSKRQAGLGSYTDYREARNELASKSKEELPQILKQNFLWMNESERAVVQDMLGPKRLSSEERQDIAEIIVGSFVRQHRFERGERSIEVMRSFTKSVVRMLVGYKPSEFLPVDEHLLGDMANLISNSSKSDWNWDQAKKEIRNRFGDLDLALEFLVPHNRKKISRFEEAIEEIKAVIEEHGEEIVKLSQERFWKGLDAQIAKSGDGKSLGLAGEDDEDLDGVSDDEEPVEVPEKGYPLTGNQGGLVVAGGSTFYVTGGAVHRIDKKATLIETMPFGPEFLERGLKGPTNREELTNISKVLEWRKMRPYMALNQRIPLRAGKFSEASFINLVNPKTEEVRRILKNPGPGKVRREIVKGRKDNQHSEFLDFLEKEENASVRKLIDRFIAKTVRVKTPEVFAEINLEPTHKEVLIQEPLLILFASIAKAFREGKNWQFLIDRWVDTEQAMWNAKRRDSEQALRNAGWINTDARPDNDGSDEDGEIVIHDFDFMMPLTEFHKLALDGKIGFFFSFIVSNMSDFNRVIDPEVGRYFLERLEKISFIRQIIYGSEEKYQDRKERPRIREILMSHVDALSRARKSGDNSAEVLAMDGAYEFFKPEVQKREENLASLIQNEVPPKPIESEFHAKMLAEQWQEAYGTPYENFPEKAAHFRQLELELGDLVKTPYLDHWGEEEKWIIGILLRKWDELDEKVQGKLSASRQIVVGRKVLPQEMSVDDPGLDPIHFAVIQVQAPNGGQKIRIIDFNAVNGRDSKTVIQRFKHRDSFPIFVEKERTVDGQKVKTKERMIGDQGSDTVNEPVHKVEEEIARAGDTMNRLSGWKKKPSATSGADTVNEPPPPAPKPEEKPVAEVKPAPPNPPKAEEKPPVPVRVQNPPSSGERPAVKLEPDVQGAPSPAPSPVRPLPQQKSQSGRILRPGTKPPSGERPALKPASEAGRTTPNPGASPVKKVPGPITRRTFNLPQKPPSGENLVVRPASEGQVPPKTGGEPTTKKPSDKVPKAPPEPPTQPKTPTGDTQPPAPSPKRNELDELFARAEKVREQKNGNLDEILGHLTAIKSALGGRSAQKTGFDIELDRAIQTLPKWLEGQRMQNDRFEVISVDEGKIRIRKTEPLSGTTEKFYSAIRFVADRGTWESYFVSDISTAWPEVHRDQDGAWALGSGKSLGDGKLTAQQKFEFQIKSSSKSKSASVHYVDWKKTSEESKKALRGIFKRVIDEPEEHYVFIQLPTGNFVAAYLNQSREQTLDVILIPFIQDRNNLLTISLAVSSTLKALHPKAQVNVSTGKFDGALSVLSFHAGSPGSLKSLELGIRAASLGLEGILEKRLLSRNPNRKTDGMLAVNLDVTDRALARQDRDLLDLFLGIKFAAAQPVSAVAPALPRLDLPIEFIFKNRARVRLPVGVIATEAVAQNPESIQELKEYLKGRAGSYVIIPRNFSRQVPGYLKNLKEALEPEGVKVEDFMTSDLTAEAGILGIYLKKVSTVFSFQVKDDSHPIPKLAGRKLTRFKLNEDAIAKSRVGRKKVLEILGTLAEIGDPSKFDEFGLPEIDGYRYVDSSFVGYLDALAEEYHAASLGEKSA